MIMDKRNRTGERHILSVGALGVMVFFAFGSVSDSSQEFGNNEEIRLTPVADAADVSGTGLPECDAYLKQYRCFLEKSGVGSDAADSAEKAYKQSVEQAQSFGMAMATQAITDACKQTADSMREQFEKQGC